jgi:hypothetical protein
MTAEDFNEKYKAFLEEGHYGLDIYIPEVIDYLDEQFRALIHVEGFSYSQIKLKFGMARVYCEPPSINTFEIESEINRLVKAYQENPKT